MTPSVTSEEKNGPCFHVSISQSHPGMWSVELLTNISYSSEMHREKTNLYIETYRLAVKPTFLAEPKSVC